MTLLYHSFLSSFTTYHRVCNKSNTTDVTSANPSGAHKFAPGFAQTLVFCLVF